MQRLLSLTASLFVALGAAKALAAGDASAFTGQGMPYSAFDQLAHSTLKVDGGEIVVGFAPGEMALARERVLAWIEQSAKAVAQYYGGFPVRSARLLIVPVAGRGVTGGQAFGYRGPAVRLMVGTQSTAADLDRDWQAVHEMVHLALPDVAQPHAWLAEGLAVYVESIARVQAGDLTNAKVWGEFVRDMPKGLPGADDQGLDHTPTWGRTYWGGAIFCLLADIEIRKRTGNRMGLQQALRAIVAAGGTHDRRWPVERIFAVADQATGTPVLSELYARMKDKPSAPDLATLWQDLGVISAGAKTSFNDVAVMAPIRTAITTPVNAARSSQ